VATIEVISDMVLHALAGIQLAAQDTETKRVPPVE